MTWSGASTRRVPRGRWSVSRARRRGSVATRCRAMWTSRSPIHGRSLGPPPGSTSAAACASARSCSRWRLDRVATARRPTTSRSGTCWAVNHETIEAINTIATEAIAAARLPVEDRLPGVRALDLWRDGPNGAMLFWADAEADLNGWREPVLCDVCVQRTDGAWRVVGGASCSSEPLDELRAGLSPGLHRFSRSSANRVFLTWALATPEVAMSSVR